MSLAAYAVHPDQSQGRLYDLDDDDRRNPFHRDHDRIIHSRAFRRLQFKTQVFVSHEGDFYRTRLTHSLEVSQIARTLCRHLSLNEDLGVTIALAHDLGHPPFGHTGEDALTETLKQLGEDAFDHNDQCLRILTLLESSYPEHPGLNLTWETVDGIAKHNGPLTGVQPDTTAHVVNTYGLQPSSHASLEAQVAAVSDDVAYNAHDVDDGLRAGLFAFDDLKQMAWPLRLLEEVDRRYPGISDKQRGYQLVRFLIGEMVADLVTTTRENLTKHRPESPQQVYDTGEALAAFSTTMTRQITELRQFLFTNMYRHESVNTTRVWARAIVSDLFMHFMDQPKDLPEDWQQYLDLSDNGASNRSHAETKRLTRLITDYIAGMTDRFAQQEHGRLVQKNANQVA